MSVSYGVTDRVAVLTVNNPPVNALSLAVRQGLSDGAARAAADDAVDAVVIMATGRTFMAGADIREFGKPPVAPHLPEVIDTIEALEKPVVAAIHGTALGGGLEVALGCHYRIALESAKIGLPEVKLGILPGAGGTQRLPRVGGVDNALQAMLTGRHIPASTAATWGAVDKVLSADADLQAEAVAFAKDRISDGVRRTRDMVLDGAEYGAAFFEGVRASIAKQSRGYFAPERIIRCVEAAVSLPFDDGMARERELFAECQANPQARALQHLFFAERQVARVPGVTKETPRRDIRLVGILGAGTMGGGIALAMANAGIAVTLLDTGQDALDRGLGVMRGNWERTAKKGRMTMDDVDRRMGLITPTLSYDDLADCDLIIEAVFEKMDIKREVFARLDAVAKPGAILATNTSYLDVNDIAAMTARPDDVLGLHFFSPANVMRLLEIVRAEKTADSVLATALDLAKRIGKIGVVSGVCHGFIGNRMLGPYGREAMLAVIGGTEPQAVDKALFDFGMPMGPNAMSDMAGLDVGYFNRQSVGRENYETSAYDWVDRLVEMGRKGQKTGEGIYKYPQDGRTPEPDPVVADVLDAEREKLRIVAKPWSAEQVVERCMLALINEGAKILGEGIALRASDIDVVYINGYGFPPYRGGPMHYADAMGLPAVLSRIKALAVENGPRWWMPAPLLERLVDEGKSFADFDRENA
ncbi:3-hydroxyacyl-CoA dehydrogenase NAD-binding domain-containing protein [Eilatimonas milleporae]|uniref:Short chain enoyl-CoA hydratase /3-hydroxyacyl-CoA dehydrogenase n=1 Tax=Eilatimonas milleporae TaxID=911205 RepID=A0A3M0CCY0_9PROT|nr:3-hydroxyacyl-CoA dehydrogenase NAD-binding domain-containing protein [Eilatimonas milleporae]RMB04859.1 short chain enoyl-CoA hydratase /3-hydroxyacyl-CoA dehydrogenase [Eilatimonas milleporae]